MTGLLGTRADFFSDLLLLALFVVAPVLGAGLWLARSGRRGPHRVVMLSLMTVLVLYVVVYETNLTLLGGTGYLTRVTPLAPGPYLAVVAGHVALGMLALAAGSWAIRRGAIALIRPEARAAHARVGWSGAALLGLTAATGVGLYWATFVL